jgi:hypothetical protein
MAAKKKNRMSPAQQHARFVEAAKKAEADESPDALDKAFKTINPRKVISKIGPKKG